MMSRTCGCGQVTTAPPPPGVTGGPVCYGPNVTGAATLLASTDVIGAGRAADLMGALLRHRSLRDLSPAAWSVSTRR